MSRGHHTKLLRGRPVFNGWTLYGYRPDREAGVYRVHEPEAAVVRRVFSLCAEGHGMHRIASTFNREGLPSPKSALRPGARWTSSTVGQLLGNRSYAGDEVCWKTTRSATRRDLPRPESEWVRLPEGVRPAIISRELFEECRRQITSRAARMNNVREYPTLLRGHIFCGECGARMIRNDFRRGKYEYLKYRCGSRWRPFDTGCRGEAVPLAAAEEWAWGVVNSILLSAVHGAEVPSQPSADLEAARLAHESAARALRVLLAAQDGDALRPYLEQATRVEQRLGRIVDELEKREGGLARPAATLRRLCERAGGGELTFDERRLALEALRFKAFANGDDPGRWRYEASI